MEDPTGCAALGVHLHQESFTMGYGYYSQGNMVRNAVPASTYVSGFEFLFGGEGIDLFLSHPRTECYKRVGVNGLSMHRNSSLQHAS